MLEFAEQVLAKPLRAHKTRKKLSLKSKWVFGTWLGLTAKANEHLVALPGGGPVIRVRTVKRRSEDERWNAERVLEVKATPRRPNPKDESQQKLQPERLTVGVDLGAGTGVDLPEAEVNQGTSKVRDFKITKQLIQKFEPTPGCKGCEGSFTGLRRDHSQACRTRL